MVSAAGIECRIQCVLLYPEAFQLFTQEFRQFEIIFFPNFQELIYSHHDDNCRNFNANSKSYSKVSTSHAASGFSYRS